MKYSRLKVRHAIDKHYGSQSNFGDDIGKPQATVSRALLGKQDASLREIIDFLIDGHKEYDIDYFLETSEDVFREEIQVVKDEQMRMAEEIDELRREISIIKRAITQ